MTAPLAPAPLAPGVHDLPPQEYFADPQRGDGGSVTASICRNILPPEGCPALVAWEAEHRVEKSEFDFGHAVHKLALGKGAALRVLVDDDGEPYPDYRRKACQDARDAAYAEGVTPLLEKELKRAQRAADAVLSHPVAGRLLAPGTFEPEQTLIWRDVVTGVWRRGMLDALAPDLVVDLKSCTSANPRAVGKQIAEHKYDQQQAFYEDGLRACLGQVPPFVLVFVERDPPHLVAVRTIPPGAVAQAAQLNREAIDLWAWCVETGQWPGWVEDITEAELPRWRYRPEPEWW